jgi:uncharacterized membrane protein YtjA (UPF0391 family)
LFGAAQWLPGCSYRLRRPNAMLHWTLVFLVLAIIAAILGFAGIAGMAAGIAKILFFVFLVVWIISFFIGRRAI